MKKNNTKKIERKYNHKESISFQHFCISQTLNFIVWAIPVWLFVFYVPFSNTIQTAMNESFYFLPLYMLLVAIMYFVFWKPKRDMSDSLMIVAICSILLGGTFLGVFFGVFYNTLQYGYTKGTQCSILSIPSLSDFDGAEDYASLKISFYDEDGIKQYGYGCASTQGQQHLMVKYPAPYYYYDKGDRILCYDENFELRTLNVPEYFNSPYYAEATGQESNDVQERILQIDQPGTDAQGNEVQNDSGCAYFQDIYGRKLAAWSCINMEDFKEKIRNSNQQYIQQDCYYTTVGDESKAIKNSSSDINVDKVRDFYQVIFEEQPYYDKRAFLLFVAFCLIPFLLFPHFLWLTYPVFKLDELLDEYFEERQQKKLQQQQKSMELQKVKK